MFKMAEGSDGCSGETLLAHCTRKNRLQRKMTEDNYWVGVQEYIGMFNSVELLNLHNQFMNILKARPIDILSFGESLPVQAPYVKLRSLIVPRESSDLQYGRYISLDCNHIQVCKPQDRLDSRYAETANFIHEKIKNHEDDTENMLWF